MKDLHKRADRIARALRGKLGPYAGARIYNYVHWQLESPQLRNLEALAAYVGALENWIGDCDPRPIYGCKEKPARFIIT